MQSVYGNFANSKTKLKIAIAFHSIKYQITLPITSQNILHISVSLKFRLLFPYIQCKVSRGHGNSCQTTFTIGFAIIMTYITVAISSKNFKIQQKCNDTINILHYMMYPNSHIKTGCPFPPFGFLYCLSYLLYLDVPSSGDFIFFVF